MHVTRDGGKTWTNVTPKDMPEFGRVSSIDASTLRARRGVRRGQEAAARRPRALHLPHPRLRQDVDEDRRPAFRPTTTCTPCARIRRAAACSTPARSTAFYISYDDGDHVAAAVAQPARRADLGRLVSRPTRSRLRRTAAASTSSTTSRRCATGLDTTQRGLPSCSSPPTPIRGGGRRDDLVSAAEAGREDDDRDPRRQGTAGPDDSGRTPGAARCWRCAGAEVLVLGAARLRRAPRRRRAKAAAAVADADAAARRRRRWRPA